MRAAFFILCAACLAARADPPGLTPVARGYDDINPLAKSLRPQPYDLRMPMNFERVYKIDPSIKLFGNNEEYFARVGGGLMAVFPRSTYIYTQKGRYATIPPGTVWVLGLPEMPRNTAPDPNDRRVPPMDTRVDTSVSAMPPQPKIKADDRTIWTSDIYRQQRVTRLLDDVGS